MRKPSRVVPLPLSGELDLFMENYWPAGGNLTDRPRLAPIQPKADSRRSDQYAQTECTGACSKHGGGYGTELEKSHADSSSRHQ